MELAGRKKISRYNYNVSYFVILVLLLAVKWPKFEHYM